MTLQKRQVTRDHLQALIELSVRPDQQGLVAPNVKTFAQAPFEPGAHVWGLWDGAEPVGLMAIVHPGEYPFHEPGDDREAAYLWRLMIAAGRQGCGHGRAAVGLALEVARDWGCPRLVLGVIDREGSARGFYERLGFRWTGRIRDGERILSRETG